MIACLAPRESRDHRDARFCAMGERAGYASLHDLHRRGCGPQAAVCVATAGSGRPLTDADAAVAAHFTSMPPLAPLPHWARRRGSGSKGGARDPTSVAADFAAAAAATVGGRSAARAYAHEGRGLREAAAKPPDLSGVMRAMPAVARLYEHGYLNCTFKYDELKDSCAAIRPDMDWLQWVTPAACACTACAPHAHRMHMRTTCAPHAHHMPCIRPGIHGQLVAAAAVAAWVASLLPRAQSHGGWALQAAAPTPSTPRPSFALWRG